MTSLWVLETSIRPIYPKLIRLHLPFLLVCHLVMSKKTLCYCLTDTPPSAKPPSPYSSPISSDHSSDTTLQAAIPTPEERERTELETKAMLTRNSLALEAQLEERPLAKKQEELQGASTDAKPSEEHGNVPSDAGASDSGTHTTEDPAKVEKAPRKALLKNDDSELQRIRKVCYYHQLHAFLFEICTAPGRSTQTVLCCLRLPFTGETEATVEPFQQRSRTTKSLL